MSEHRSKHSGHAAVGETRLRRVYLDIPDTVVKLPDGGTMTLRRRERSNSMPAFRKFNPRKMQPVKRQAGRQQGRQSPVSGLGAVMDAARNLPLSKLLLAATLAQHAFQALRGLWCRWRRRQRSRRLVRDGSGQLVPVMEEDEEEEGEEEGWEEPDPQALAAEARELLPAMMRAALPKARRPGLAKQAAEAARSKARLFTTARQMMRPGPGVKRRPTSVLEKLDKAVQKQTRQLVISSAQQRREEQMRTLQALHDLHQATLRLPSTASTQQQATSQAGPAPVNGVSGAGSEATGTSTAAAAACPVDVAAPAMTIEDAGAGGCSHASGDLGCISSTSTPASSIIGVRRVR
ncbi:hypothetical protein V8C86DRAFT_3128864 [Haematococcus lacustris]